MQVKHVRAGGPSVHPVDTFEAEIVHIEDPTEGPFGFWSRCLFRTPEGIVSTLISPEYGPDSDLERLASQALRISPQELPDELDTDLLCGHRVLIHVVRSREHGAAVALARVP